MPKTYAVYDNRINIRDENYKFNFRKVSKKIVIILLMISGIALIINNI